MQPVSLLIVDDERALRLGLRRLLAPEGFQIFEASDGREAMAIVARSRGLPLPDGASVPPEIDSVPPLDIILTDLRMPNATGLDLLRYVREHSPETEVLLLTAFGEVSDAVTALKLGAANFIEKPFEPENIRLEVRRAQLLAIEKRRPARKEKASPPAPAGLVGDSPAMRELKTIISRVAQTQATVLILGESGTGKELVAQGIHSGSSRARGPFVAVHCGAIPESLIESELFGHVRGAFTGAVGAREGRFAQADGGTIFLDEIGEMPLAAQVKLLRVLQEHTYEPVGSTTPRKGDFRVLAATHRDLEKAVAAGSFRQDLFYRLNVVPVTVPPLRDRVEDMGALCAQFVSRQNGQREGTLSPPTDDCLAILKQYPWPGNVRELEHLIERISVLKESGPIVEDDLPVMMRTHAAQARPPAPQQAEASTPTDEGASPRSLNLNQELSRLESEMIRMALEQSGGNKNRAAQILGLNRTTLVEKIKRLGLRAYADELTGG